MLTYRRMLVMTALCAVFMLTGCVFPLGKSILQDEIDTSFEKVVASLAVLGLPNSGTYIDTSSAVTDFMDDKGGKDAESKLNGYLSSGKLNGLDKAFILYELARVKMHKKEFAEAKKNFVAAIETTESLDPKQPDLLQACYLSYSLCLKRAGDLDASKQYKAKYDELSEQNEKRGQNDKTEQNEKKDQ